MGKMAPAEGKKFLRVIWLLSGRDGIQTQSWLPWGTCMLDHKAIMPPRWQTLC